MFFAELKMHLLYFKVVKSKQTYRIN